MPASTVEISRGRESPTNSEFGRKRIEGESQGARKEGEGGKQRTWGKRSMRGGPLQL